MQRTVPAPWFSFAKWRESIAFPLASVGLLLVGFDASPFGPTPLYLGLSLLLLGLPLFPWKTLCYGRSASLLAGLATAAALWVLLRSGLGALSPLVPAESIDPNSWWDYFRSSGVFALLIGLWVAAFPRSALWGLAGMLLGMIAHPLAAQFWTEIGGPLAGQGRLELGLSPNFLGNYTAAMVGIGGVLILYGVARLVERRDSAVGWGAFLLGLYSLCVYTSMWIASGSRHAWIAGVVSVPVVLAVFLVWGQRNRDGLVPVRYWIGGGAAILALVAVLAFSFKGVLVERFGDSAQTIRALVTLQPEHIETESLGQRVLMWAQGWEQLQQHPWGGWGPGGVPYVRGLAEHHKIAGGTNYHNTYLHMAVGMGIPWVLLWLTLNGAMIAGAIRSVSGWGLDAVIVGAGLSLTLVVLVSGLAEYRLHSVDGFGMYLFGTGLLMGCALRLSRDVESGP
ncbi:O-antigen ligase family protein [Halorhodospira neutriphila]|uniref:O-antigen ligase-related domain-containing protein n=1 Tax=Halorhodospira neutriphila TaxID=168379 RepID=A0ABS1E1N4_9GAMM|nr:O-antigen ligase family protein [Halorhodospira neutriphila]MBK1725628.1 hypothetical protein [Halorhodospira neutriphila]